VSWSPLTLLEEDAIWDRLQSGLAAKPAAREFGLPTGTVRAYLARCGGIRPLPRTRSVVRLTLAEREEISRGLAAGLSLRAIAVGLGAPSTISREVSTHGGRRHYRALAADQAAWRLATRPKPCRLTGNQSAAPTGVCTPPRSLERARGRKQP
jgi:Helix-turn-helix domain